MTVEQISMSQFAMRIGKNKGTVSRDCKALGIHASHGLGAIALEKLLAHYGLDSLPQESPASPAMAEQPTEQAETAGQVQVIQPGINYTSAPIVPSQIDLSRFGFQPVQALDNPMAVAQALVQALDATEQGLEQYLDGLDQQAKQTKAAAQTLADRRRQFERSLDKAELLATIRQADLSEAEAALNAEAAALGKSAAA